MSNPPPADLRERDPLLRAVPVGDAWFRGYRAGRNPAFFGKNRAHRWDAPNGEYGVLYLGADEYFTFLESIGRGAHRTRFVPAAQLKWTRFCKIGFARDLRLIDFAASGGLTRLGAEGSIAGGSGYRNSQRWSLALASGETGRHSLQIAP